MKPRWTVGGVALAAFVLLILCGAMVRRAAAAEAKSSSAAHSQSAPLGEPLAPGIMKLLEDEVRAGLKNRPTAQERFSMFENYLRGRLAATNGPRTGSEVTGNCRLGWYEHLLANPLAAPGEAEEFTRLLHKAVREGAGGLAQTLPMICEKLDLGHRTPRPFATVKSSQEALGVLKEALVEAQTAYAAALSPLNKSEIRELTTYLYPTLTGNAHVGHTLDDRTTGRRLCDLMEKMDRAALIDAAEALVPLTDPKLLAELKKLPEDGDVQVEGVTGRVVAKIDTPAGAIVVGGKGPNTYQLDQMPGVAAVVDLGGDDEYYEGTVSPERPVLVIIDLAGNDHYKATKPGVQGGAILGVSMLLDRAGNDVYEAQDVAQGACLGGVGILIDYAGNDSFAGVRRVQGAALGGLGILINHGGNNSYHGALWTQGYGGPLGFGLLDNIGGGNHYYSGGLYVNSYKPETPGYEGWGQGVGGGIRQVASGGIGIILNGGGNNVYEFDYLSHGGGYWCGLGFARDFGGNSQRLICRKDFYGHERSETLFQRFGCGWGCHYALGFCFDDGGHSLYEGTIMGSGMGWDNSVGVLANFAGNNRFEAAGGNTQGCGAQASLGILFNYGGNNTYLGYGQGYAANGISYHDLPACGGNFSFVVDYGGNNKYGCGATNSSYLQRGDVGGFLISRPSRNESTTKASEPASTDTAPSGRTG
jgi:hypothetical protein